MKTISKLKHHKNLSKTNIIFADIETIIIKNNHRPFAIGWSHNENFQYIYINEINEESHENIVMDFIKEISLEFKNPIVYFHNMARFDGIIIIRVLAKNKIPIDIVERNNIIYQITININNNKVILRDSYLIIPEKLENIGKYFTKKHKKMYIEYNFNEENIFTNKNNIIEYLKKDVFTLSEGFITFQKEIFDYFKFDIIKSFSLSSISFKIFRTNYYEDNNKVYKNTEKMDNFIRKSYFGGMVDVFIPYLTNGYCYDANSLYPYAMTKELPVGKGTWIFENINIEEFYGFLEVNVCAPNNLKIPLLPTKTKSGTTITPIGSWTGVYYSEEIKYAIKLGYKFKYIKGIRFEKGFLLKKYMEKLYNIRISKDKINPMNKITKLLMNSLYGRWGMKQDKSKVKIVDEKQLENIIKKHTVIDINEIYNNTYYVCYNPIKNKKKNLYYDKNFSEKQSQLQKMDANIAVHVASAITSIARIYIYKFKTITNNNCYYTDTDSIFLEKPLEDKHIGDEMGKFKLEYKVDEGIFIAPKTYIINEKKITFKGLDNNIKINNEWFKSFIYGKGDKLEYNRTSLFRRDLKNLEIKKIVNKIKNYVPFTKREKIYINKKWVDTKPLNIKNNLK